MLKIIFILLYLILVVNGIINICKLYSSLRKYFKYKKIIKSTNVDKENISMFNTIIENFEIVEVKGIYFFEDYVDEYTLSINLIIKLSENTKITHSEIRFLANYKEIENIDKEDIEIYFNEKIRQKKLKQKIEKLKNNIKNK